MKRLIYLLSYLCIGFSMSANAQSLTILSSGGLMSTVQAIAAQYEQQTGTKLIIKAAPSMGNTPQSVPSRLKNHELADVVVMVGNAIPPLQASNLILKQSRVNIANSSIAMAVKQGAPTPTIDNLDQLRDVLLNAKSIAYSDSASGVYLSNVLFKKLGIEEQLKDKAHMIPATPVGEIVAEGKAEIGFQQYAELLPVKGITIVGLLPQQAQRITVFSAAIVAYSHNQTEAKRFIDYLKSKAVHPIIKKEGLEPITL